MCGTLFFFVSFSQIFRCIFFIILYSDILQRYSVRSVQLLGNIMSAWNHPVDQNCGLQLWTPQDIGVYVLTSYIDRALEKLIVDECCNQYNSVFVVIANLHSIASVSNVRIAVTMSQHVCYLLYKYIR